MPNRGSWRLQLDKRLPPLLPSAVSRGSSSGEIGAVPKIGWDLNPETAI
jgi:hypothetical protein